MQRRVHTSKSRFSLFSYDACYCVIYNFKFGPCFKSGSARKIVRPLRNNMGRTLVHHATWHTSNGTLFTPLLIFQKQGNMEPMNERLTNLKHPQSSMEPLNRREPDDYRSFVNTRFATIHFPETCLHGRLELERGVAWFREKEPSHSTIHFPRTCLHSICYP